VPNADFVVPVEIDGQVHQVGRKDILFFSSNDIRPLFLIREEGLGGV
jgi:hypothetical protein